MTDATAPLTGARDRLTEIEAREQAAAKGPWYVVGPPWNHATPYVVAGHEDPHFGEFVADMFCLADADPSNTFERMGANGKFIAHARTDVPALVRALRAALRHHEPADTANGKQICPPCSRAAGIAVLAPCEELRDITTALTRTPEAARASRSERQ